MDTFTSGEAFFSNGPGGSSASLGPSAVRQQILAAPGAGAIVPVRPALLDTLGANDALQHLPGANLMARIPIATLYSGIASGAQCVATYVAQSPYCFCIRVLIYGMMALWHWGPLLFNACLVAVFIAGFATIILQPELLVSWFFCILRAVPYYAAFAGNRMYDQLTLELRSIFTSIPPDTVTMPTSISQKFHVAGNVTAPSLEVLESIMQRLDQQQSNKNWDMGAAALAVLGTAAVVLAKKW